MLPVRVKHSLLMSRYAAVRVTMHVTNLSAMPKNLGKQVTVEQMAGLLKYIKRL